MTAGSATRILRGLALGILLATPQGAALAQEDVGVVSEAGLIKQAPQFDPSAGASHLNDYPTTARADYVFGCMQVNGQTPIELAKCSCSIDVIASIIPYDKYVEAETIMSVRLKGGESTAPLYSAAMKTAVNDLKRAQVEGELKCF